MKKQNASEIRTIIREHLKSLGAYSLADDENMFEKGAMDSFGVLQFIAFLEERFGLVFEPQDVTLENFGSINSICRFIEEKKKG